MMHFLLIRHGVCDGTGRVLSGRAPGVHLSERGREQAARLGERLSGAKLDALYTSPLERARETADAIAARCGLEARLLPELGEVGFGDWTGRALGDLEADAAWGRFNRLRSARRPPGGELLLEVQARALAALLRLADAHDGGRVGLVSHADVIRGVLAHFAGVPLDLALRLDVSPASVSVVALYGEDVRVLRLNDSGDPLLP